MIYERRGSTSSRRRLSCQDVMTTLEGEGFEIQSILPLALRHGGGAAAASRGDSGHLHTVRYIGRHVLARYTGETDAGRDAGAGAG